MRGLSEFKETFCGHITERVSGFPEERGCSPRRSGWLLAMSGELLGKSTWEIFQGTSGLLLRSTVREVPGKTPGNFWGNSGKYWESVEQLSWYGLSRSLTCKTWKHNIAQKPWTHHRNIIVGDLQCKVQQAHGITHQQRAFTTWPSSAENRRAKQVKQQVRDEVLHECFDLLAISPS